MSESSLLFCGVPVLALLLASHGVEGHFYANDCQIYLPIASMDETNTKVLVLLYKDFVKKTKVKAE